MLASMSATEWSELAVSDLPTGTVTLLLADVEGSTRLWQTRPDDMTSAVAALDRLLTETTAAHNGVRPVEQGEGDSFVVAFARATDAVACALELQRAPLSPIRMRIGLHTGEIQLRDEGNYIGPTINRAARLRDLAHGGQTVLSGATEPLVVDWLPTEAWLADLGTHPLRDFSRPERVAQLCHPDLPNDFPPLRVSDVAKSQKLPVVLTSFVGRQLQITDLSEIVANNRLVTLTGAGGVGKTRLALKVAAHKAGDFRDGVWYVDLSAVTDPGVVALTVARTFGLPDQPGRSTVDTVLKFVGDRQMLVVLDNCEHLLDASAELVETLFNHCPSLRLMTTSREPISVAGEVTYRVPSLSLDDEAIELFTDRARRANPGFRVAEEEVREAVAEICRRLDGIPLAIELAAARVRALSLAEILASLHNRFRLLTGGSRTAVRRQQTLRASVDWSHALLTEPERVLFRRLATFMGGFDLDAAQSVCVSADVERYQVMDQLTLLVDKSLVTAENVNGTTRYRMLETVRQYAQEKLGGSGESDETRKRHRDYYTSLAASIDSPWQVGHEQLIDRAVSDIDNLRAAYAWSRETGDLSSAATLAMSLYPMWITRGRVAEGLSWIDDVVADIDQGGTGTTNPACIAALARSAVLNVVVNGAYLVDRAQRALDAARDVGDPVLLARALVGRGYAVMYDPEAAHPYFAEALALAEKVGDVWSTTSMTAMLAFQILLGAGDPVSACVAAQKAVEMSDAAGIGFRSRECRTYLGMALALKGDLAQAAVLLPDVLAQATAAADGVMRTLCTTSYARVLAWQGQTSISRTVADSAIALTREIGGYYEETAHASAAVAALADGDIEAAEAACDAAWRNASPERRRNILNLVPRNESALATGDLVNARRIADEMVSVANGCHLALALTIRARIAMAQGDETRADQDLYDALAVSAGIKAFLGLADTFEGIATRAVDSESYREAARLLGAAEAMRDRTGEVRFKVYDAAFESAVGVLRGALGDDEFDAGWAEGAALSSEEAIAYAQRGRGERKRPSTGWASLTPTELDVVRLVREGLANKDIAARLFVSPRTVQTHLTHVYTKLGLTSRVQLAQEAARHG
jgi:predicted ATPase/class 3 adenylate cyclase/DNA-binding CsgD family transcriptional regulator